MNMLSIELSLKKVGVLQAPKVGELAGKHFSVFSVK